MKYLVLSMTLKYFILVFVRILKSPGCKTNKRVFPRPGKTKIHGELGVWGVRVLAHYNKKRIRRTCGPCISNKQAVETLVGASAPHAFTIQQLFLSYLWYWSIGNAFARGYRTTHLIHIAPANPNSMIVGCISAWTRHTLLMMALHNLPLPCFLGYNLLSSRLYQLSPPEVGDRIFFLFSFCFSLSFSTKVSELHST